MTEQYLCLSCNRPMALHQSIPVNGGLPDITIWRCAYCPAPSAENMKDGREGDSDFLAASNG